MTKVRGMRLELPRLASKGRAMTILPVLKRELVAAARQDGEHESRFFFTVLMLVNVLGTFTAWYFWEAKQVTNRLMSLVAERSYIMAIALHGIVIIAVMGRTARCVAIEKDRRTLDFLLATRLNSTEIVLGKLAAHVLVFLATLAAGLPIMLLLHTLGGLDGWLICLAYTSIVWTGVFLSALAIWFSVTAPDSRKAIARAFLCSIAWFSGPFFIAFLLPRLGIRLPDWLLRRKRLASGQQSRGPLDEAAGTCRRKGVA